MRLRAAYVSLAGSLFILGFKFSAFLLTGSIALLSDAAESIVNVVASVALIIAMHYAAKPADYEHPYGHSKAEYFSSIFEAVLILVAAGMILLGSIGRLVSPQPLDNPLTGLTVAAVATALNLLLVIYLRGAAKRQRSIALESNAKHTLVDVWTSLAVIAAVGLILLTEWLWLDGAIGLIVGLNIVREGVGVMGKALSQLLDERLPEDEEAIILKVLDEHPAVLGYHRLRSRRAGLGRFAELDIFVDPALSVAEAHRIVGEIEAAVHGVLPNLTTTIHVEPYVAGEREGASAPRDEYPAVLNKKAASSS